MADPLKQAGTPLLVVLAAAFGFILPQRGAEQRPAAAPAPSASTGPAQPTPATAPSDGATAQGQTPAAGSAGWPELNRLLEEFLGPAQTASPGEPPKPEVTAKVELTAKSGAKPEAIAKIEVTTKPGATSASFQDLIDRAEKRGYAIESMIALVPDPIDSHLASNFDQALDAIQRAHAAQDYLLDRFWLPWSDAADLKAKRYRDVPGVMFFTKNDGSGSARLEVVFLVGETPKAGLQKKAFLQALSYTVPSTGPAGSGRWIKVMGPSFSGSAESLRLALLAGQERAGAAWDGLRFWIVTGSATARGLPGILTRGLAQERVSFSRMVVGDDQLQNEAYAFFEKVLEWDLRKAALLVEADTAYGQQAVPTSQPGQVPSGAAERHHWRLVPLQFPSRLSALRKAWEKGAGRQQAVAGADESWLRISRPEIADLSLADPNEPTDVVPELSPLTAPTNDLAIANLLTTICREGFRYVGLLATDVRDKLYLIHRVREFCPDVLVFTFDNNLLYAYPRFGTALDGTLIVGSSPLYTQGAAWLPGGEDPRNRSRRQFSTEFQQGLFNAVEHLLGSDPGSPVVPSPQTWISVVGNGSLWPISRLPMEARQKLVPQAPQGEPGGVDGFGMKIDLQLVLAAIVIGLLLWGLHTVVLPAEIVARYDGGGKGTWGLLALGAGVLWLASSISVVLVTLPVWGFPLPRQDERTWYYLITVGLSYAGLLWMLFQLPWPRPRNLSRSAEALALGAAMLLAVLLLAGLARLIQQHWMPGGAEFFYLRVRSPSSGLSPIVPLVLLGGAFYVWTVLELKRRKLSVRHQNDWPIRDFCEPPFLGCSELAATVVTRLRGTWPQGSTWRLWLILATFLAFQAVRLTYVQPVAETREYGRVFLGLVLIACLMSAISFYRFVTTWWSLQRVLYRLDHARLSDSFTTISKEVDWNPMKSFGWQIPSFKLQLLSARRIRSLIAAGKLKMQHLPGSPGKADRLLARAFQAERSRRSICREIVARRRLREIFEEASQELEGRAGDTEVDAYRALRTVAFIRYVFAHLRNCLMGAMASGLLLLAAVSAYAFEPKRFLSLTIWTMVLGAVLTTVAIFIQMDRNATLSAISGTNAGKLSLNRHFFSSVFAYGVIPLLGLVAVKFPQMGHYFISLVNPLLRVFGTS